MGEVVVEADDCVSEEQCTLEEEYECQYNEKRCRNSDARSLLGWLLDVALYDLWWWAMFEESGEARWAVFLL